MIDTDDGIVREHVKRADLAVEAGAMLEQLTTDGVPRMRFWKGSWWNWRGGRYDEYPDADMKAMAMRQLNTRFTHVGTRSLADMMEQLRAQAIISSRRSAPCWLAPGCDWPAESVLATSNELVNLPALVAGDADCRRPSTPCLFTTSALDYPFDPDAPPPVKWLEFLNQLWPDDPESISTLQEWFGYLLTPDTRQQKMLMLIGQTRSGKGTIGRVMTAVLGGTGNVAGPGLASLAGEFGLAPLVGKTAAIFSDARISSRTDQATVIESILRITGEDMVTINRKHRDQIDMTLPVRLMLISNELPRLTESSGALVGRMIILKLTRSFYGQENTALTAELLQERTSILKWAIEGWERLRERGHFQQPASGAALRDAMEDLASPAKAFADEACNVGAEFSSSADHLYKAWCNWCVEKGRKPSEQSVFGKELFAAFPTLTKVKKRREDGTRYNAYQGIAPTIGEFRS